MLMHRSFLFWAPVIAACAACGNNDSAAGNPSIGGRSGETGGTSTTRTTQHSGGLTNAGGSSHSATTAGGTSATTVLRTGGTSGTGGTESSPIGGTSSSSHSSATRAGGTSATGGVSHSGGTSESTGGKSTATGGTRASTGGTKASTGGTKASSGGTAATGGTAASGGTTNAAGTSGTLSNVVDVIVDEGPSRLGYLNGLFVDVTLCVPGTSNCQTIDHILVDTGSYGLRVLESALTVSLPTITGSSGAVLAECTQYVSGTAWGPIVRADVKIGGETAAAIPVQTVGESKYPMPTAAACTGVALNDLDSMRSNGILGVGFYQQDCGEPCARTNGNPGIYMGCTSNQAGGCKAVAVPVDMQVSNPIVAFATNNNGLVIQLPDVPDQGAATVAGKMVFGIGTQSNNGLGSATVLAPVNDYGYIGTSFPAGGTQYQALLDSGSNAVYFLNPTTSGLAACGSNADGFYCPASTANLSATVFGAGNASVGVNFKVANINKVTGAIAAFKNVGGEMPGFPDTDPAQLDYIWGLSFFYGRTIFTAIEKKSTPGGTGPYVAF